MTLKIVIFGFFLNLLWEVLHSMLYDWNKDPLINDIFVYIPRITRYGLCTQYFMDFHLNHLDEYI